MKKELQAVLAKLEAMQSRADELADSENEDTAAKYETVSDALNVAIEGVEEALEEFK